LDKQLVNTSFVTIYRYFDSVPLVLLFNNQLLCGVEQIDPFLSRWVQPSIHREEMISGI
jgi:hypothetical protein